jgi:basic membrane lipoprotein Med (substrate-binding protein (PBP1-ABC) superfamily)
MPGTRHRNNLPKRTIAAATRPMPPKRAADRIAGALRSHPRRSTGAALLVLCVIAAIVYLVWPTPDHGRQPAVRARTYTNHTACLLTDATGITGTAAPVWTGMQDASGITDEKVSYLTMRGADTAANADTYINTLALRGCDIILADGASPDQGITDRAAAYPKLRFIAIAGPTTATPTPTPNLPNVTTITETTTTATSTAVRTALVHADATGAATATPTAA